MITLKKVSCVECPQLKDYIEVSNCRGCAFHVRDAGRSVECSFKHPVLEAEKTTDKEFDVEW